jgi:hypothetical protein
MHVESQNLERYKDSEIKTKKLKKNRLLIVIFHAHTKYRVGYLNRYSDATGWTTIGSGSSSDSTDWLWFPHNILANK